MSPARRAAFARLGLFGFASLLLAPCSDAFAETYQYDALGRVVCVAYPNGQKIVYVYDKAGNRIQIVRTTGACPSSPPPPPP